jgi:hypothetical protein
MSSIKPESIVHWSAASESIFHAPPVESKEKAAYGIVSSSDTSVLIIATISHNLG